MRKKLKNPDPLIAERVDRVALKFYYLTRAEQAEKMRMNRTMFNMYLDHVRDLKEEEIRNGK